MAGKRGILVLLDMHRARANEKWELWYTREYSYEDLLRGWHNLMDAYKHEWNVMGIDLLNEPHGLARWESGDRATDWNRAAEDMIVKLARAHADWPGLFFVEGVSDPHPHVAFWGSNLFGVHKAPIDVGHVSEELDRRVVYSPHTYGPSVQDQEYFHHPSFPRNMPGIWDDLFGFTKNATGRAVVVGEWGGFYHPDSRSLVWVDAFAAYLRDRCLSDNIYWDLNPNVRVCASECVCVHGTGIFFECHPCCCRRSLIFISLPSLPLPPFPTERRHGGHPPQRLDDAAHPPPGPPPLGAAPPVPRLLRRPPVRLQARCLRAARVRPAAASGGGRAAAVAWAWAGPPYLVVGSGGLLMAPGRCWRWEKRSQGDGEGGGGGGGRAGKTRARRGNESEGRGASKQKRKGGNKNNHNRRAFWIYVFVSS
jgi:hypothetical protein